MFTCSLFSVCAGGSLGPEAPLLCLCASTVSYVFQKLLPVSPRMLRYCSLMGMAAGLAAFFGVTMGGALPTLTDFELLVGTKRLPGCLSHLRIKHDKLLVPMRPDHANPYKHHNPSWRS